MPVAPEKEADRVAPVSLVSLAEPVVTTAVAVAVWPPEVPPPDSLHSQSISIAQMYPALLFVVALITMTPVVPLDAGV